MEDKMDFRIQKTHLALHSAFTGLLEEKSFNELTVYELCDRAMIRRTTFYTHFADKYEYFTFYFREVVSTIQVRLAPDVMDGDLSEYLLHLIRELFCFFNDHAQIWNNIKSSSIYPLLPGILLEQITEGVTTMFRSACPSLVENSECLKSNIAFYCGGLLNILFQQMRDNSTLNEIAYLEIAEKLPHWSDFLSFSQSANGSMN